MTAVKRYLVEYADWSHREYLAIAKNLLLGRVHRGPDIEKLRQALAKMYAPAGVHLLNYGHHAIEIALEIFKEQRPGRLEVIGPAYICPSVPSSVARRGLQWRSVDVGEDLNIDAAAMKAAIGSNTLAVIAPHMYGCPADIQSIESICKDAGIYLIDDAAQAVGIKHGDRLLGTFGDVGVLSFAQSKMVVTGVRGSGGAILMNNKEISCVVEGRCAVLPVSSGRWWAIIDFLWNYLHTHITGNSGYYISRLALRLGLNAKVLSATRIGNLESAVALVQLDRMESIIAEKQRLADIYDDVLKNYPALYFRQYVKGRVLARLVIETLEEADMNVFMKAVARKGVQVRKGYPLAPDVHKTGSEFSYVHRLLGVPSGRTLNKCDVENICLAINEALHFSRKP